MDYSRQNLTNLLRKTPVPTYDDALAEGALSFERPVGQFDRPVHWDGGLDGIVRYTPPRVDENLPSQGMLFAPQTINTVKQTSTRYINTLAHHEANNKFKPDTSKHIDSFRVLIHHSRMPDDLIRELGGRLSVEPSDGRGIALYRPYNDSVVVHSDYLKDTNKRHADATSGINYDLQEVLLHELGHRAHNNSNAGPLHKELTPDVSRENVSIGFGKQASDNEPADYGVLDEGRARNGAFLVDEAVADGLAMRYSSSSPLRNLNPSSGYAEYASSPYTHPVDRAIYHGLVSHIKKTGEIITNDDDVSLNPVRRTGSQRELKEGFLHKLLNRSEHARNVVSGFSPSDQHIINTAINSWSMQHRTSAQPTLPGIDGETLYGYEFPADHYPIKD